MYFQAATAKGGVPTWANGTETYYALRSPMFGSDGFRGTIGRWVTSEEWSTQALTWGSMAVEIFLVFGVIGPWRAKRISIPLVILLHGSFAIFIGIPSFAIAAIAVASFAMVPAELSGVRISGIWRSMYGKLFSRKSNIEYTS